MGGILYLISQIRQKSQFLQKVPEEVKKQVDVFFESPEDKKKRIERERWAHFWNTWYQVLTSIYTTLLTRPYLIPFVIFLIFSRRSIFSFFFDKKFRENNFHDWSKVFKDVAIRTLDQANNFVQVVVNIQKNTQSRLDETEKRIQRERDECFKKNEDKNKEMTEIKLQNERQKGAKELCTFEKKIQKEQLDTCKDSIVEWNKFGILCRNYYEQVTKEVENYNDKYHEKDPKNKLKLTTPSTPFTLPYDGAKK